MAEKITDQPLLVSNPTNIRYLTGFVSIAPEARESWLVVLPEELILYTNMLYTEQAQKLVDDKPMELVWHGLPLRVIEYGPDNRFSDQLASELKKKNVKTLGIDERNLTLAEYATLKEKRKDIELTNAYGAVENLRQIKRPEELEHIRKAVQLTDECFEYIKAEIEPGVSEKDLAWSIESFIRTRGGTLAFPPIVAFDAHASMPHYQYSETSELGERSIILFDFGARISGYCADMTRMVCMGTPDQNYTDAYDAVLEAQKTALSYLESGKRSGKTADEKARRVITDFGLPEYTHSLGHALGLDIHEAPRLTKFKDQELKPGMVVTVEPAVYLPGEFGIRIEDTVLITDNGIEILTKTEKELIVL